MAGAGPPSATALSIARRGLAALSRRRLLVVTLAVLAWRDAAAQAREKMSKTAAHYQDSPRGGLSCIGCTFFERPRSCKVVEGDISPLGWCMLFDLPD
jgi:hypothetical protein